MSLYMSNPQKSSQLTKFFQSFYHAGEGLKAGLKERSMRIHAAIALIVATVGIVVGLSQTEWFIVLILMGMVLAAELFNTAIESVCDHIRDDLGLSYQATEAARDIAAGAVLIIAAFAAIIGLWIFPPKFL